MRRIPGRPSLPIFTSRKLSAKSAEISASLTPVTLAKTLWQSSRGAAWFSAVVNTLGIMSGHGQRCMYCSGSESAQVEHYNPKSLTPNLTFAWSNYLWVCGTCNNIKGNRFTYSESPGNSIKPIDPTAENPWDYFFIDEFGNLSAKWDPTIDDLNQRALWTINLLGLDRQALQESRQARLEELREKISDTLRLHENGDLSLDDIENRLLEWFEQPFQPDIADYFLAGPGSQDGSERFKDILTLLNTHP